MSATKLLATSDKKKNSKQVIPFVPKKQNNSIR